MKLRYFIPLLVLLAITIVTVEWIVLLPSQPTDAHSHAMDSAYTNPDDEYYLTHSEHYAQFPCESIRVTYCLEMTVDKSDFDSQTEITLVRADYLMNDSPCIALVDYDNRYVRKIADFLNWVCNNDSDMDKVRYVTQFVDRNIEYHSDSDIYGFEEYWATPIETLYLRTGDCEDKSILACSILLAMGLDGMLINYENHCAPAVRIDGIVYLADFNLPCPSSNLMYDGEYPSEILSASDIKDVSVSRCIGGYIHGIRRLFGI